LVDFPGPSFEVLVEICLDTFEDFSCCATLLTDAFKVLLVGREETTLWNALEDIAS